MSRAAGIRLAATLLPALVLLGAVGQTPDDGIRLPTTDAHYKPVKDYVEAVPQADYNTRRPRRSKRSRTSSTASASTGASTRNVSPAANRGRS